jgi:hypothetical protein
MLKYCVAALWIILAWLTPGMAWAAETSSPVTAAEAAEITAAPAPQSFSDTDITTFAEAYRAVQTLRIQAEGKMADAVEAEGLSIDRFNAIANLQLGEPVEGDAAIARIAEKAKITKQEDKQFKTAIDRIADIRQSTEGEMEKAIEATGLSVATFNAVMEQSVDDTTLQRQISDEIVKQTLATMDAAS